MRKILVFSLCLSLANITYVSSNAIGLELLDFKKISKIYMKGSLNSGSLAKSTSSPVEVYQDDQRVNVCFQSNLGTLKIVVVNQHGYPMYQGAVNATNGRSLSISTRFWQNGNYFICISDSNGGYMEGEFTIE